MTISGQHSGQHQELHGRDPKGLQCIDLFVHLHGAELSRITGAGTAGHDDPRHDGAHHPDHGYAHEVGHIDLGAEGLELDGTHEGEDQSYKHADEGNNGKSLDT